jgi:hypothetical protein
MVPLLVDLPLYAPLKTKNQILPVMLSITDGYYRYNQKKGKYIRHTGTRFYAL